MLLTATQVADMVL